MDGVLVNFPSDDNKYKSKQEFWDNVLLDEEFWENLPAYNGAVDLVIFCLNNFETVDILTAAPKEDPRAYGGKINWLKFHLGHLFKKIEVNIVTRKNKQFFAGPNSLLVDDKETNCREFNLRGGGFVLHRSIEETVNELKNLVLSEKYEYPMPRF